MKPLTADNNDGRVLLALRAGAMASYEFSERGLSVSGWLIREGLVDQVDGAYRITEAGRKACPLRNPLSAKPARQNEIKQEPEMSRDNCITRQQVLAAILETGNAGCTPKSLIERFDCSDSVIYNHINLLGKQQPPVIYKPEKGRVMGIQFSSGIKEPPRKVVQTASIKAVHATRESVMAWLGNQEEGIPSTPWTVAHALGCTEESTRAVLAGLYAGLKVNRQMIGMDWGYFIGEPKMETQHEAPAEACGEQTAESSPQPALSSTDETQAPAEPLPCAEHILPGGELLMPTVKDVEELAGMLAPIAPAVVEDIYLDQPDDVEFAIFSSGGLDIYCAETTVTLNKAVLGKLRAFLGLFQEVV